jgi:hypothetical protein
MAKYFMMECIEPMDWDDSAVLRTVPLPVGEESWRFGRRFRTAPIEPIVIELLDTHSDQLLEMYKASAFVITKRLLRALEECGVGNLDVYETVIRHPVTKFETSDYVAANLIGLIGATDLNRSTVVGGSTDRLIDVDFDAVAIDEAKTKELLMFRLAENTSAIVVHERLKTHLLSRGFDSLDFLLPDQWVG